MKSPGFSMFEIIIVMAVSTIIMTSLFQIYNQTARNMNRVQRFVFEDTQILTLKHRFTKDVAGLSAIWFKQSELEMLLAIKEHKQVPKGFKKQSFYFYSTNKGDNFDRLTFLTTSALQSYGKTYDRFVRVVYILQPDPANQGLFRLMRKEISPATEFIDEAIFTTGQFYELIAGIKLIEFSYHLVDRIALNKQFQADKNKKNDEDAQSSQEETQSVVRLVKQWQPIESMDKLQDKNRPQDANQDENKDEDLGGAPVPKFIEMKIVFGATLQQQEQEFNLSFAVASTVDNMPKSISAVRSAVKNQGQPADKNQDRRPN